LGLIEVEVIEADARDALPLWQGGADAWYLDGFSPAKNPELWGNELMAEVARHTALHGTFATYTAAGHVRRALAQAGFTVRRAQGYGTKRHMSCGVLG
jgi:tRNA U34 5-methylaminomethyl-2-thiouridine-forming methyltransferase MnmC